MAAEFYRKSTALYEEFKRRELHYLNVERNCNNSSLSNDINLPLDDYLESISKRERETERSFRSLLQNLEEMDKQTDQMSLKLEKLNALRDAAVFSNITTQSSMDATINRMHTNKPYYESAYVQNIPLYTPFYPTVNERTIQASSLFDHSSRKIDSHSESTQTEHIFCDNCHYPFTRDTNRTISNPATELVKQDKEFHFENVPLPPNLDHDIYKSLEPSREILNMQPKISGFTISQDHRDSLEKTTNNVNASMVQNLSLDSVDQKSLDDKKYNYQSNTDVSSKEITNLIQDKIDQTENNISEKPVETVLDNNYATKNVQRTGDIKDIDEDTSRSIDEKYSKSKSFDTVASKSDDESVNHEFDFLESNRRPSTKNKIMEPESPLSNEGDIISETVVVANKNDNALQNSLIETSAQKIQSSLNAKPQNGDNGVTKDAKYTKNVLALGDAKIESSLSEGSASPAHHSADVSNHSESDSSLEKEAPFSASAAYQALLGNAVAPKAIRKAPTPSDSDSEDEIENVVSSNVRRTSKIDFDGIIQAQKKEERKASVPEVTVKLDKKSSKPGTTGVSQSKLSKNTRKVLGLETSSGSEMELEAKPSAKIIEEDSDEFDFYN